MGTDRTIALYEDSRSVGTCRGCQATIDWFETRNGKRMPMEHDAVATRTEHERSTMRLLGYYWSSDAHWATCPARDKFK